MATAHADTQTELSSGHPLKTLTFGLGAWTESLLARYHFENTFEIALITFLKPATVI